MSVSSPPPPAAEPSLLRPSSTEPPAIRPPRRPWRRFVLLVVLALLVLAAFVLLRRGPVGGIEASGIIEATQSDVASKVQGRLIELRATDGSVVKSGQVVATLDRTDPALGADQASAAVAAAQAQVAAAQAAYELARSTYASSVVQAGEGVRIAQSGSGQAGENLGIETQAVALAIDQGRAQLLAAAAADRRAKIDLARARSLVRTGDLSQQALDDATNAQAAAAAQYRADRDALALAQARARNVAIQTLSVRASLAQERQARAGLQSAQGQRAAVAERRAQVAAAQGQLAQARATLAVARSQVRETDLVAPFDGSIVSHNFEVGDLVQPGSAVMTIADLTHPYLNVYVSESDISRIKTGMRADVTIDGQPGRTYVGRVTEIADSAEFTPENVQTKEQRIEYLVFRVKIQFYDATGALKPGLPADAVLR